MPRARMTGLFAALALAATLAVPVHASATATAGPSRGAGQPAATTSAPTLAIDATRGRRTISSGIYGVNWADTSTVRQLGITVDRAGGNTMSRFNHQVDVYNTGSDWYFENIAPTRSGFTDDGFIQADRAARLKTLMTVPMMGWVAKGPAVHDHPFPCGFKISRYGPQADADWQWDPDCGNGVRPDGSPVTGNDPRDTSVAVGPSFVQAWVSQLVRTYGDAAHGGVPYYGLDNEPALWNSTHRDVHPAPLTYDELVDRSIAYASAVKAGDATAKTFGPSDWGWCAYFYSAADPGGCSNGPDKAAHGGLDQVEYYLRQLKAQQDRTGLRLLDYLDEHYYPQSGVALTTAGDASGQSLRLRSTRSLWDPTYRDESWISDMATGGVAVRLIPRMREWVAANYPGTKLAITEYNFGGLESLNGALAQADVLGIFAREGVDVATLWGAGGAAQPWAHAFRMYRNYDGAGGAFGETWVQSASSDQGRLAVYGSLRARDGAMTVVVVNKTGGALSSPLSVAGFTPGGPAQVWRYSGANLGAIQRAANVSFSGSTLTATYPANSITTLVIPKRITASITPPATSTGSIRVAFSAPVNGVTTSNVVLRRSGYTANLAARITCYRGSAVVSCSTGMPTSALLKPTYALVRGRGYVAWVNPSGATPVRGLLGNPVVRVSRSFSGP